MTRTTEQFYDDYLAPKLNIIAQKIKAAIDSKIIHTLEKIDDDNRFTFGSYAVNECWSELNDIIRKVAGAAYDVEFPNDYKEGRELNRLDLIDMLVSKLDDNEFIHLEW